ncbi:MAG TPA: OsmC family peroxiredoxin [Solirubrobacteraceae bacterium]|nr:OsmC family peroxiredoxin [Solirubrobacteraceae bacterium]
MAVRTAKAEWRGALQGGEGTMSMQSGSFEGPYSFASRFEEGTGTNPEELIAAAHAGCFSMALSGVLGAQGHEPESIATEGRVQILKEGEGFAIKKIELVTRGRVSGIDQAAFEQAAQAAKESCPVSVALGGVETITVEATLES